MASKWRTNIPDIGAVAGRWVLIARLLSGGEGYDYLCKRKGIHNVVNLMTPIVSEGGVLTFVSTIRSVTGRFPYGYDVEPDVT